MPRLISNPFLDTPKTNLQAAFWFTVMVAIGAVLGLIVARLI